MAQPLEQPYYTPDEYFAIEEHAEYRSEYFDGEIFAMAGGTANHNRITVALSRILDEAFEKDGTCEVFSENIRLQIQPNRRYTYPDIMIVCGKPDFVKNRNDTMTNPKVIIEVLSDSTEAYDRGRKFAEYRKLATLCEYVLIEQNQTHIESFVKEDNGTWRLYEYDDMAGEFPFISLGIVIPIQRIYRRVDFSQESRVTRVKEASECYGEHYEANMASSLTQCHHTLEEYFAIEERTEYPNEYLYGEVLPRVGITSDHNCINGDACIAMVHALKDTDCQVFMCQMRVEVQPDACYLYPDIVVVCGTVELAENIHQDTLTKPMVIVEVFSESTETYDRGSKFAAYCTMNTLREYILIDQNRVHIEAFVKAEDGSWNMRAYNNLDGDLPVASLNITISIQAIYRRVEFPAQSQLTRVKEAGEEYGHDNQ